MTETTHSKELLAKNIALWEKTHSPLPQLKQSSWKFCQTGKKQQLNLQHEIRGDYLHSSQNIDVEVRQWVGLFDPHLIEWVIVFGVGLGAYYLGLKNWLMNNPKRHVIFVEDDLSVLYAFLETNVALELLSDPQASLMYLSGEEISSHEIEGVIRNSLFRQVHITALSSYQIQKPLIFERFSFTIRFFRGIHEAGTAEYLTQGKVFLKNFYANTLSLDDSFNGLAFLDQFKDVPAIICGAGPSLAKNIEVLKTLKDRALIFAGGTAMNVLNAYEFLPHFGCGVDPLQTHFHRILANIAFETPFFYRSRMNAEALTHVNGPHLYLPGTTGYAIAEWMDEKLGYPPFKLDEGSNVINTSLSIARKLGCNPILIVGLDLSYTDGLSYAPGLKSHAIHTDSFTTKSTQEELVLAKDIYDQPIYTLMKWMIESSWYAQFARLFPDVTLINCTEGGIGFSGVPNSSLKDAQEKYLQKTHDIEGKIATILLSNEAIKKPTLETIKDALNELVKSLSSCGELFTELQQKYPEVWNEKIPPETDELKAFEAKLEKEIAYQHLLKPFDVAYKSYMQGASNYKLNVEPSLVQELMKGRFPYLADILLDNLRYIQKALTRKLKREKAQEQIHENPLPNKAFGIHQTFYKDGKLKSEIPYTDGHLDGQVRIFYPNGVLRRSSFYKMGKREGKDNLYYVNGTPLIQGEYSNDKPIGKAFLWHVDGPISKEITYSQEGKVLEVVSLDVTGNVIEGPKKQMDYMDTAINESREFQHSMNGMKKGLASLMHVFKESFDDEIKEEISDDMQSISDQIVHLQTLHDNLMNTIGNEKEAIWKTPSNENQLYAFLQGITSPMQEAMLKLQWQLKDMIQEIEKKNPDDSSKGK